MHLEVDEQAVSKSSGYSGGMKMYLATCTELGMLNLHMLQFVQTIYKVSWGNFVSGVTS